MKKLLLIPLVSSILLGYEGCGVNKKEALDELSKTIYVNINNKFKKKETLNIGIVNFVIKNVENESTQTTNLTLKNVKYIKKNGEICAIVSKKDVEESAKEELNYLLSFNTKKLPNSFEEKQKVAAKLLPKIQFVKAVLKLNRYQINKLTTLEKKFKDLLKSGEVIFNVNIPNAIIKISGLEDKEFKPSTSIILPAGEYSYKIIAKNKCPIIGKFIVEPKKSFTINKELGDYPIITLTSNQKNVQAQLNGRLVKLNKPITLHKCSGNAIWSMTFEDQIKQGSVELNPGVNETITQDFVSRLTIKKMKEKIDFYTHSQEVVINYGYGVTNDDKNEWDSEKRIEIRKFNNYGTYKFGIGLLGGTQSNWTINSMNEVELVVSFRAQFPEIADKPLHIYKMPLVPYFGIEGGFDFYKFFDKFSNYDINNITPVFRGVIGSTFLVNKQFGLNVEYSHDFAEKRDHIFTAGIVMDF